MTWNRQHPFVLAFQHAAAMVLLALAIVDHWVRGSRRMPVTEQELVAVLRVGPERRGVPVLCEVVGDLEPPASRKAS